MTRATSVAAFKALKTGSVLRDEILEAILSFGKGGCIGEQIRAKYDNDLYRDSSLNARYSELERRGLIYRNGETRPGTIANRQQLVMRHHSFSPVPVVPKLTKRNKNPFLAGMMHATKVMLAAGDYTGAKAALKLEIKKVAKL